MTKPVRTLAVITARGGSKGIPRKNIKELCGKPLIAYAIEAAKGSKLLTRCIVSTDDKEIADISKKYGGDVPFMRPAELAQDASRSIPVVQHALKWLEDNEGENYDYVMILQPTSPLRTSEDIDACIKIAVEARADSVMSMAQMVNFSPEKTKKVKEGIILPFFLDRAEGKESSRRQDDEKAYIRNCVVFLTSVPCIKDNDLFGKVSRAYIMPNERSMDIDAPVDFELAEFWMKKLGL